MKIKIKTEDERCDSARALLVNSTFFYTVYPKFYRAPSEYMIERACRDD